MKISAVATVSALCLALTACGGTDDDRPGVVASFYPTQFLADRIGGDTINVTTLTTPGAEAHDLELTAKQVIAINEADVVIHLEHFQEAVDAAIEDADRTNGSTVDIGEGVSRLEELEDEDDHDGHDHGEGDPHVWLDPANLVTAAGAVRDALVEADPNHQDSYDANADDLVAELQALDAEFAEGLKSCERTEFVTSHAAFGHLAHAYGLTQVPISGIDSHSEPGTATLVEITELVKREGITTVFTEPLTSPALAETVARETGATTAVLDPIEGLSDETAAEDYVSLMRQNLAALQQANGCS